MQRATEETERDARQDQRVLVFNTIWIVWLLILAYLGFVAWMLLQEEDVKLYSLHSLTKFFQSLARVSGTCALLLEQRYNEHIELLH